MTDSDFDAGTGPSVYAPSNGVPPRTSVVGLIGLILGVVALGAAFAGPWAWLSWVLAVPALILGLVGASRPQDKNALPIAALVASGTAFVISLFVLIGFWAFAEGGQGSGQEADSGRVPVFELSPDAAESGELTVHEVGETWEHDTSWEDQEGTVWDIAIDGYVELPFSEWAESDRGSCYAIVGTLTPTRIADGAPRTFELDTPLGGLYVDDALVDNFGSCDVETVVNAGYEPIYTATVPLDTDYRFYMTISVLDGLELSGDIQYIWAGSYLDPSAGLVEPVLLELP